MGMGILDILEVTLVLREIELTPEKRKLLTVVKFRPMAPVSLDKCENCLRREYVSGGTELFCMLLGSYSFGNCVCDKFRKR